LTDKYVCDLQADIIVVKEPKLLITLCADSMRRLNHTFTQWLVFQLALTRQNVSSNTDPQVVFGDPYKGQPIQGISPSKIFTNCDKDDPICKGTPIPLGSHLTYGSNLGSSVDFVKSHV
jgi:hypothetical protein